jgi:UPF0755 protein
VSTPSRRTLPRGPGRARAGGGRTLLWLVLILVMAGAAGWTLARDMLRDDAGPVAAAPDEPAPQRLLIREGLRREDVARLLDRETGIPGRGYLQLTAPGARGRALAGTDRPTSLEGFLFPATYEITDQTTARDLVDQQIAAFRAHTADIDYSYARARNLTPYEVLIIASMIEREVAVPRERPLVASVIYNRLRSGMRLDIDATVQYALGRWAPELTASDLAVDSPYNTRLHPGLPPGPIASPGKDSIRAASRPARTPYLYYVARGDGSGRHRFATTPEGHEANVRRAAEEG